MRGVNLPRVESFPNEGIYWKEETDKSAWRFIPNTLEEKRNAINRGAMFFTWTTFPEPYDKNKPEPLRAGDMPLDFDDKENPARALDDMKKLCLLHLPELYDLDPYSIEFYCSGGKGFHAVIPKELFGLAGGDPYLPKIYKWIAHDWTERFQLTTLDLSMYCMGKGKMFRIPNVRRRNGKYKVPLTLEEVQNCSISEILKLSEAPRNV